MAENKCRKCPVSRKCGGCVWSGVSYKEQLKKKQASEEELLSAFGKVEPIIGMEDPMYYRNKVHHVFDRDRTGAIISGSYERGTHYVVNIDDCQLEDEKSQAIMATIRRLARSFKLKTYDEDSGYGLLRHVLIRRAFKTGEIMVVLVLTSSILPGKNNFVKALRDEHPEITTIVINVNDRDTSMVLGSYSKPIYGPGFIKDELCGCTFRISPSSFYQVNPVQTEVLYKVAADFAELTGEETVIDAYCGIGTIGLSMAAKAKEVIGVELNADAVRDAVINARENHIENVEFIQGDAGEFMQNMAREHRSADVILMDPPRTGSTEQFMRAAVRMAPSRIVYVSCGPDTLATDLEFLTRNHYKVTRIQPVDMFPFTEHCETVVLLVKEDVRKLFRGGKAIAERGPQRREYSGERTNRSRSGERPGTGRGYSGERNTERKEYRGDRNEGRKEFHNDRNEGRKEFRSDRTNTRNARPQTDRRSYGNRTRREEN